MFNFVKFKVFVQKKSKGINKLFFKGKSDFRPDVKGCIPFLGQKSISQFGGIFLLKAVQDQEEFLF